MVQLVNATPDLMAGVCDMVRSELNLSGDQFDLESVVNYPWQSEESPAGFALVDDGRVVGFHGTIFSQRVISGQTRRLCNLHTWVVKPAYRGQSLALFRPILRMKDCTLTDLTAARNVYSLMRRLGFEDLDPGFFVLAPCSKRADRGPKQDLDIVSDAESMASFLSEEEAKYVSDHRDSICRFVVFRDGGESCLLAYTNVRQHWFSYCYIHYIGNRALFERYQAQIRNWLMKTGRCWFAVLDSRFANQFELANAWRFPYKSRKLFRSGDVRPDQIDSLYTELTMGGGSAFPNFSHGVIRRLRGLLGASRSNQTSSDQAQHTAGCSN